MAEKDTNVTETEEAVVPPGLSSTVMGPEQAVASNLPVSHEMAAEAEGKPTGEETPPAGEENPPEGEEKPPEGEEKPPAGEEEIKVEDLSPDEVMELTNGLDIETKDGEHTIPFGELLDTRKENQTLKDEIAALKKVAPPAGLPGGYDAHAPAGYPQADAGYVPQDQFADLRNMSESQLSDYSLDGEDNFKRVMQFQRVVGIENESRDTMRRAADVFRRRNMDWLTPQNTLDAEFEEKKLNADPSWMHRPLGEKLAEVEKICRLKFAPATIEKKTADPPPGEAEEESLEVRLSRQILNGLVKTGKVKIGTNKSDKKTLRTLKGGSTGRTRTVKMTGPELEQMEADRVAGGG